ncbi:MAG: hypothetical protein ACRDRL_25000 [Sciscionella sp.]
MTATIDQSARAALEQELTLFIQVNAASIAAGAVDRMTSASPPPEETQLPDSDDDRTNEQRRQDAIQRLRDQGFKGKSFQALARAAFNAQISELYFLAENATNGHLLTNKARSVGVDAKSLFTGPETRARKWASRELLAWWEQFGRLTFEEHCAELLGYGQRARNERTRRAVVT